MDVAQMNLFHQARTNIDKGERRRVHGNIANVILSFCRERLKAGGSFTMSELEEYVNKEHHITPGSGGRILRELKLIGRIQYNVKDRAQSTYCLWSVS
jgi:hypothetical protein